MLLFLNQLVNKILPQVPNNLYTDYFHQSWQNRGQWRETHRAYQHLGHKGHWKIINPLSINNLMWLFLPHCLTIGIAVTVVLPDKIWAQHSIFSFLTSKFPQSRIWYLVSDEPDISWIKTLIPLWLFNKFTNTDDESVISGQMLIHRKIIESDIWQQSIFSKTVRVQLCGWSWAAPPHNVWKD